jgi:hypothetical protein
MLTKTVRVMCGLDPRIRVKPGNDVDRVVIDVSGYAADFTGSIGAKLPASASAHCWA